MKALQNIAFLPAMEKWWVLGDQMVVSGSSFLTVILAARNLPVTAFGWLSLILLIQLFILTIQNALLTSPYLVLHAGQPEEKAGAYTGALFRMQLLFDALILLTGVFVFLSRPAWLQEFRSTWWWALLLITGFLLQDFLRRILITRCQAALALGIDLLTNVFQLAILLALCLLHRLTLTNCIMAMGGTYLPSILLGCYWLRTGPFDRNTWRYSILLHWKQGKWLLITSLLQWWAGNFFILAAGVLLGVEAFGGLRLTQSIFGVVNVLLQAFENYVLPHTARLFKQHPEQLWPYLRRIFVKGSILVLPLLCGLFLLAKPVFALAGGHQYREYYPVLRGFCILYLIIWFGYPVRILIRVLLLNSAFFFGYLAATGFSLLAAHRLVQWWGITGVTAGLLISQCLMTGYWSWLITKQHKTLLWR